MGKQDEAATRILARLDQANGVWSAVEGQATFNIAEMEADIRAVLVGLPNTTGNREAVFFRSATGAVKAMRRTGCAATAAADNGCLNVWIDDDDQYRCEAQRFMVSIDSQIFSTFKDVVAWVKKWLPKIQR